MLAVALGLALIWVSHSSEFVWKGLATVALVFLGAALTLTLSKTFEGKLQPWPPDGKGRASQD